MTAEPDPAALAALTARIRVAVPAVLLPMAGWGAVAGFTGLWPAPDVDAFLLATLGFSTLKGVIVGSICYLGLGVLAVLVPLAIVVNVARALRG